MANIVIVSSHCYLLCESIHHISMDIMSNDDYEIDDDLTLSRKHQSRNRKTSKAKLSKAAADKKAKALYRITINFVPVGGSNTGGSLQKSHYGDSRVVQVLVQGEAKANEVYKEIVNQIREQLPDQMFLDKLVEKLMQGE